VPKDYESRMTDKLKTTLEVGQLRADKMEKMKEWSCPDLVDRSRVIV
jgi:hypothetical protein